jgi:hypothetical protein
LLTWKAELEGRDLPSTHIAIGTDTLPDINLSSAVEVGPWLVSLVRLEPRNSVLRPVLGQYMATLHLTRKRKE